MSKDPKKMPVAVLASLIDKQIQNAFLKKKNSEESAEIWIICTINKIKG